MTDLKSLAKKNRKEFIKNLRQTQDLSSKRQGTIIKVVVLLLAIFIVAGLVFLFTRPPREQPEIGQAIPELGRNHIAEGTVPKEPYNSNPPTSGPHWAQQAECKIYTEEVADQAALHSMEHGGVWISYKNKDDQELIKNLTSLVQSAGSKVLLSPRAANDSAIAVASWARLLKLENFDEKQIADYIRYNKNKSPEPLAAC